MIEHYEVAERRAELGTLGPWTLDGLVADVHRHAAEHPEAGRQLDEVDREREAYRLLAARRRPRGSGDARVALAPASTGSRRTFRHTFGSWLVQAGVDTFVVGKLMGHKDSKMVERYYGHLALRNRSEAMARLPRFPALFPTETALVDAAEPCDAGVPNLVAIPGADGAHGAVAARTFRTKTAAVSDEKRPPSTGEGRRTRTFN